MNCEMFIVLVQKSSIFSLKKYYHFHEKVLSFSVEDNIWLKGRCYL